MADFPADGRYASYDDEQAEAPRRVSFGSLVTWVGAALSITLVAGVGIWGYRMVMRDVSGVPIVRAMTGESRRVPDSAGGEQTAYQGFSVNHVAASQGAADPAREVRLAPAPMGLGDAGSPEEREAMEQARAQAQARIPTEAEAAGEDNLQLAGTEEFDLSDPTSVEDLASAIAAGTAPLDEEGPKTVTAEVHAPADPSGLHVSVRPKLRPDALLASVVARSVVATNAPAAASAAEEVAPEDVPAGTRLAQLGAFASREIALQEWDKFVSRFEIYMEGKSRVIQRAESGGRIFYRLRVMGFSDLSDSRRFCAALVAEGADCIPVPAK